MVSDAEMRETNLQLYMTIVQESSVSTITKMADMTCVEDWMGKSSAIDCYHRVTDFEGEDEDTFYTRVMKSKPLENYPVITAKSSDNSIVLT